MELLLDKNNKNYNNLQKIFITLKADNIHPSEFVETYINAKLEKYRVFYIKNDKNATFIKLTSLLVKDKQLSLQELKL